MKKRYILLIFLIVFGAILWYAFSRPAKVAAPVAVDLNPAPTKASKDDMIVVDVPLPESIVSNPIVIKGQARGNWFFEASAPVDVVNWDGLIIGSGYVTVDKGSDWMTTEYVPFSGSVSYDASKLGAYKYGWIIMKKDNPSGEAKFDNALEFKINFK